MAELGGPLKPDPIGNFNLDSGNHRLENGGGIPLNCNVRFKRRSVSAKRDFPYRCGRHALEGDAKLRAESWIARAADVRSSGQAPPPPPSGGIIESQSPEAAKTLDQTESSLPVGDLKPENILPGGSVESQSPKAAKSVELMEFSQPLDDLKPEATDLSTCLNRTTLLEPLNCSELQIPNQSEMMEKPCSSDQTEPVRPEKDTVQLPDISASGEDTKKIVPESFPGSPDQTEPVRPEKDTVQLPDISASGEVAKKIVPKSFPTRRVSCVRDFPFGCGRNAPPIILGEERQKAVTLGSKKATGDFRSLIKMNGAVNVKNTEGKSDGRVIKESEGEARRESTFRHGVIEDKTAENADDVQGKGATRKRLKGVDEKKMGEKVQINAAHENESSELYIKSQSPGKKAKIETGSFGEEEGKDSGKHRKGEVPEGKLKKKPANRNSVVGRSQGEGSMNSEYASDKMVAVTQIAGNEKKKDEPVVDYIQRSPMKNKIDSSSLRNEEKITKKRPSARKSVPRQKNKPSFKHKKDSVPHDGDDSKSVPASQELSVGLIPFGPHGSSKSDDFDNAGPRRKVREALRMFQSICRKLLREEETNSNRPAQALGRIDLVAVKLLKESNKCVNTGPAILGPVPGVEVGDEFHFRVELAVVGLHRPYQSGIDYTKQGKTILATSVVASGGYADDIDSSDSMIYSGQGGKPASGDKQAEDQKLERGNLALKNSIDAKTPVRVIHGFKESSTDARGRTVSTFTYDGLYLVEKYWQEEGAHGCAVFKFLMRRIPGQPELAIKEVKKSKKSAERDGLCIKDISQGKEKKPICVINTIDDDRPIPFKYITKMIYPSWYKSTPPKGCDCPSGCSDSNKCVCVMKNGGDIPFNYNGAIVEAKPLVYECGPSCKCPRSCHNRVSQHGIKFQLEVFKTESRGWGVRSLSSISSGSFICEYTGELLKDKDAEQRTGNDEYLFDIGSNLKDQSFRDGLSALVPTESQSNVSEKVEDGEYTIDAAVCGNIGRFINHSCSPNLYAQNVLYDHDDKSMPHIMFFAAENIPPLQELTYHYNYTIGQVHDSNGNVKQKDCYCGSHECTGRLY